MFVDEVGDPVCEHPGLARTRTGDHQQGASDVRHGLVLRRVQSLEKLPGDHNPTLAVAPDSGDLMAYRRPNETGFDVE